jgi:hypothetical protein
MFQRFSFSHGFSECTIEHEMGAGNCPEILETGLEEEFERCYAIQEQSDSKNV